MAELESNIPDQVEQQLAITPDPLGVYANPQEQTSELSDAQLSTFAYNDYTIVTLYQERTGKYQMPVCGPVGSAAAIVKAHAAAATKTVRWVAQRVGQLPVLPHPDPGNEGETLIYKNIDTAAPVPQPNGLTLAFQVTGTYVYALDRPLAEADPLHMPTVATLRTAAPLSIPSGNFDRTLLRTTGGSTLHT